MTDVSRYCVECERLTAERDQQAADLRDAFASVLAYDLAIKRAEHAEAERDRYRAALERIAGYPFAGDGANKETAQDALNGGDDE